jgi:hypothetical protein
MSWETRNEGYLAIARRLVSVGEGGGVVEIGERGGELKDKSVDVPNQQRAGVLSNGPKACEVVRVVERICWKIYLLVIFSILRSKWVEDLWYRR